MANFPIWDSISLKKTDPEAEILNTMENLKLFEGIPRRGLKYIRSMCHIRYYNAGQHIFRVNEPGVGLYILLEGEVEIYQSEKEGNRILKIHSENEFFGELGLLDDNPRSASARAVTDSRLMGFFRPDLESIIVRKPALASVLIMNIARVIGEKLILTNYELMRISEIAKEKASKGSRIESSIIEAASNQEV